MFKNFKRISAIIAIAISGLMANAEINIGVAIPDQGEIQGKSIRLLDTRLKKAISSCGVSSTQWGDFFLVPTATIVDEEIIETGMKKIFRLKVDMTLNVEQLANKANYGAETWTLKGTGDTREKALTNAFANWQGDRRFAVFIDSTKKAIEEYFVSNRAALLAKARQKANAGEFDEALAILSSYPTNLEGSEEVIEAMNTIYNHLLANECGKAIQEARSAIAMSDYGIAAYYLSMIKPDSPCIEEAQDLQVQIRENIKEDDREAYNREQAEINRQDRINKENADRAASVMKTQIRANERVEKARMNAISEVAKAYYSRSQAHYHYHIW